MTNWQVIKQLWQCAKGNHIWQYWFQGIEGYDRECEFCCKHEIGQ